MPLTPLHIKIYTALLSQTGTDPPTATILHNTLGDITWTRESTGTYRATLTGQLTIDKTWAIMAAINYNGFTVARGSATDNFLEILTRSAGILTDTILDRTEIEIRVYTLPITEIL